MRVERSARYGSRAECEFVVVPEVKFGGIPRGDGQGPAGGDAERVVNAKSGELHSKLLCLYSSARCDDV